MGSYKAKWIQLGLAEGLLQGRKEGYLLGVRKGVVVGVCMAARAIRATPDYIWRLIKYKS